MGKGSNIRPRKVPKQQYDDNWDRIFGEPHSKERYAFIDNMKYELSRLSHEEQLEWLRDVQEGVKRAREIENEHRELDQAVKDVPYGTHDAQDDKGGKTK